jgi:hypothetical protein
MKTKKMQKAEVNAVAQVPEEQAESKTDSAQITSQ